MRSAFKLSAVMGFLVVMSVISVFVGMRSALVQDPLFFFMKDVKRLAIPSVNSKVPDPVLFNKFEQVTFYHGKTEVQRPAITDRTMVVFAFGQSNSANNGGERHQSASSHVYNYFGGKYFKGADPLIGATGTMGSPWVNLADKIINKGLADDVVLISAGVGSSTLQQWAPGGRLNGMLRERLEDAKSSGLPVTDFFWHQGESDNALAPAAYISGLNQIIRMAKQYFPESRFFVAQASRCGVMASAPGLLDAQRELTKQDGVFLGPNTDVIGLADRYDDCHLSGRGLDRHAQGWLQALERPSSAE